MAKYDLPSSGAPPSKIAERSNVGNMSCFSLSVRVERRFQAPEGRLLIARGVNPWRASRVAPPGLGGGVTPLVPGVDPLTFVTTSGLPYNAQAVAGKSGWCVLEARSWT